MTIQLEQIYQQADLLVGASVNRNTPFKASLEKLVESLQLEGRLSESGEQITIHELAGYLRNQYEIDAWLKKEPAIAQKPVEKPMLFMGLPRSGTTYLLHLFDHDERLRLLRTWEALRPCPPPALDESSVKPRIEAAYNKMNRVQSDIENYSAIHLHDVEGPDECTMLLCNAFTQVGYNNYLRVPSCYSWVLEHADFYQTYLLHKRQLQILQWGAPDKRWALKYPNHVMALDAIEQVYPDAALIFTHRDPDITLASLCNLTYQYRAPRMTSNDRLEVGREITDFVISHVERILAYRSKPVADNQVVVDVDYYAMMDDPIAAVEKVYDKVGMVYQQAERDRLAAWVKANPKGARGANVYKGEDYGIDMARTKPIFDEYRERFGVIKER